MMRKVQWLIEMRPIVLLGLLVCVAVSCGILSTDSDDEKYDSWLPTPTDVMGFAATSADSSNGSGVMVVWLMEAMDEVTGCNVYRTDGTSAYERINSEPITSDLRPRHLFVDEDPEVPSSGQYIYLLTAAHVNGIESYPSPALTVPFGGAGVVVNGLSPGGDQLDVSIKPTFTWDEVENAESYCIVLQNPSAGAGDPEWVQRFDTTSIQLGDARGVSYVPFSHDRLDYATRYEWEVHALDEGNFAFATNMASFTTLHSTMVPPAPTDVMGLFRRSDVDSTAYIVALIWVVEETTGFLGCNIYRRQGEGAYQRINSDLIIAQDDIRWSYKDEEVGPSPGVEYSYYVRAVNDKGESDPSGEVVVPAGLTWETFSSLSPAAGEAEVSVTPTFSWDEIGGAATYFVIVYEGSPDVPSAVWMYRDSGSSVECGALDGATYIHLDGGRLTNDAQHYWMVGSVTSFL